MPWFWTSPIVIGRKGRLQVNSMKCVGIVIAGLMVSLYSACQVSKDEELPAYQIMAAFSGPENQFPETLDQTRLFASLDKPQASFGLLSFDVNSPLWTDGAKKKRWIFVPPGEQVTLNPSTVKDLVYPVGTLLVKHFSTESGEPVETRVYTKKADLKWYFGTYVWEQGKEGPAVLSRNPRTIEKEGIAFRIPSEKECQMCHNSQVKVEPVLGFDSFQLNAQPGKRSDKVEALNRKGLFSQEALSLVVSSQGIDSPSDTSLSLERRARAYLAINCSACHQPGGAAQDKDLDLRLETPTESTGLLTNKRVVPGQPNESLMIKKFTAPTERMPPLSLRQDPIGRDLLLEWIKQWPGKNP